MPVELRAEARDNLIAGALFYDRQRESLGSYFTACLFSDLERLEIAAGVHASVFGLHRKLSQRFPFAIYYLIAPPVIDVVAILDCRRDPQLIEDRLRGRRRR
jgi:hypothetical protein